MSEFCLSTFVAPAAASQSFGLRKWAKSKIIINNDHTVHVGLNQGYVQRWKDSKDEARITFLELLFTPQFKDERLSLELGEDIYAPWDSLSGAFHIRLTPRSMVICRISGVNHDLSQIIINDTYEKANHTRILEKHHIMSQLSMAIWGVKKCIYNYQHTGKSFTVEYDESCVNDICRKLTVFMDEYEREYDLRKPK